VERGAHTGLAHELTRQAEGEAIMVAGLAGLDRGKPHPPAGHHQSSHLSA
jgi:hypothetical protein